LQRALERARVALHEIERLRAIDRQLRRDIAVAIDFESYVDAAEFRRVETNVEAAHAFAHAADDLDRDCGSVQRNAGIEHVGIGTDADLDGYDDMPADQRKMLMDSYKSSYAFRDKLDTDGFDHPKKIFGLTEALIRRGYGDSNIESVLGGNFRRLLGTVWVPAPAKTAEEKAA
jgi:microsomal dipeptidase-like Zn-dependent dipeptidase